MFMSVVCGGRTLVQERSFHSRRGPLWTVDTVTGRRGDRAPPRVEVRLQE